MSESFIVIVPARYASQRLPGKPLLEINGKPMIAHVLDNAAKSKASDIVVATDDKRIVDVVKEYGGNAVLTKDSHQSGSDRIAEVAQIMGYADETVLVNVQGDEPQMPAQLINQVAELLVDKEQAQMATLATPMHSQQEMLNGAAVKVVCDADDYALYFTRAPVPWQRQEHTSDIADTAYLHAMRHLGIYAYRAGYIKKFTQLESAPLEQLEKLEQLRALWHGDKIACIKACVEPPAGIDTAEDLERVRMHWKAL